MKELKFNEEMQRAIDEGRKTQTRRVIDPQPHKSWTEKIQRGTYDPNAIRGSVLHRPKERCPFGKIGDINNGVQITDIRVERLQEITRSDIRAEGFICPKELRSDDVSPNYRQWYPKAFRSLWQSIYPNHPKKSWDLNPWVWVITFEKVTT